MAIKNNLMNLDYSNINTIRDIRSNKDLEITKLWDELNILFQNCSTGMSFIGAAIKELIKNQKSN